MPSCIVRWLVSFLASSQIDISELDRASFALQGDVTFGCFAGGLILKLTIDIDGDGVAFAYHFGCVPFAYRLFEVTDAVLDRELSDSFYFGNLRASQHDEITGLAVT